MPMMKVLFHPGSHGAVEMRIVGIEEVWRHLSEGSGVTEPDWAAGTDLRVIEFTDKEGRRCSVCLNPHMMSRLLALQEKSGKGVAENARSRHVFGAMDLCPEQTEG